MPNLTDAQIAAKHREVAQNVGVSPMVLLELLSIGQKYANTLQADNEMMTPASALVTDLKALLAKYDDLIKRFQANLPQNQAMINEALPIIQQG